MATKRQTATVAHCEWNGRTGYRLRFYDQANARQSIWLGSLTAAEAELWLKHVAHLAECTRLGDPPSPNTTRWLAGLKAGCRLKLERVGLVHANEASKERKRRQENAPPDRLGPFLDWYLANRTAKPRTVVKWKHGRDCLLRYFNANRKLDSISHADAESWRTWLAKSGNIREGKERTDKEGNKSKGRTDLADATVRRRTGQARQFFNFAKKAHLIEANPFDALPATVHGNDARKFEVTRAMVSQMLDNAPGAEWEAIIALARFGGLRAPSEVMELKWQDVDFPNRRLCIFSPKLAHNKNKGIRYCPIFTELMPYLERLGELAKHRQAKPSDYIITKPRGSESVLRPGMLRILKLAGIPVYPKLFQNLRATRETELMDEFPIKDVCAWLGNSPKVAMEHYAMQRQESFDRAAGLTDANGCPVGCPETGPSRQLPATSESDQESEPPPFDQGKPTPNAHAATVGHSGQNGKDRPGRTRPNSRLTNDSQGEHSQLPTVDQSVAQLETRALETASIVALWERMDEESESERVEFEAAFDAKVDAAAPACDMPIVVADELASESLSITQIRCAFVDVAGRTRSDSYIRGAIAELAEVPGFRQKRFQLTDVCRVLGTAPHDLHFDKLRLSERRNSCRPQNAFESEVLQLLRTADLNSARKQELLKRVLKALLSD